MSILILLFISSEITLFHLTKIVSPTVLENAMVNTKTKIFSLHTKLIFFFAVNGILSTIMNTKSVKLGK